MKKIIIAAAIVFTTTIVATINKDNNIRKVKEIKTVAVFADKSILGTAD
jgi:hypothetical protein